MENKEIDHKPKSNSNFFFVFGREMPNFLQHFFKYIYNKIDSHIVLILIVFNLIYLVMSLFSGHNLKSTGVEKNNVSQLSPVQAIEANKINEGTTTYKAIKHSIPVNNKPKSSSNYPEPIIRLMGRNAFSPGLYVFKDANNKYFVLTIENGKTLYSVDLEGDSVKWKKALKENVLSKIYFTTKNTILFNTKDSIFQFNPDGKLKKNGTLKPGFPMNLPLNLNLFDFNKGRILVADNNTIYDYNLEGKLIIRWRLTGNSESISILKKDALTYYIIFSSPNNFLVYNQRGKLLAKFSKGKVDKDKNVDFFVNKLNNNKGDIITTNSKGKLIYLKLNPTEIIESTFGKPTTVGNYYFLYANFSNSLHYDYLWFFDTTIIVENNKNVTLYHYALKKAIDGKPVYLKREKFLIVYDVVNNIYLFDLQNNKVNSIQAPVIIPFDYKIQQISAFRQNKKIYLVIRTDKELFKISVPNQQ